MQPIVPFLLLQLWFRCSSAFYASKNEDPEAYSHARHVLGTGTGTFPPPSRSAYASDGAVKPFVGDVQTNEQLLVALEHCSYQKEIIILSSSGHIGSMDAAAQTLWMLGRFGIAHVMLITESAEACAANADNLPRACCVWAATELPSGNRIAREAFRGVRRGNHIRLRIMSRILRTGYNLMSLDTDIVIMDDPYKYFKSAPFADKHFMADGGAMQMNIGIMYVQNIASDGPVAWMFAETVDRQLSFNHTWIDMHSEFVNPHVKEDDVDLPQELQKHFRSDKLKLHHFDMVRPFTDGVWPSYLGGEGYPSERGSFSLAWQQELAIPGAPMWPESHQKQPAGCTARTAVTASRRRHLAAWLPPLERSTPEQEALYQQVLNQHRHLITTGALEGDERDHLTTTGALEGDERDHLTTGALEGDEKGHLINTGALDEGDEMDHLLTIGAQEGDERDHLITTFEGDETDVKIGGAKRQLQEKEDVVSSLCGPVETFASLPKSVSVQWGARAPLERGEYNWTVAEKAKKGLIYLASTPETPVPKLLSPTKELRAAMEHMNIIQLLETLRALYVAAHAAGRSIAWPALDCEHLTSVTHQAKAHPELKRGKDSRYSTGTVPYTLDEQPGMCIWLDFMWQGCLQDGRGLLPYETKHFLDVLLAEQAAESKETILPRPSGEAPQAQSPLRKFLFDSFKTKAPVVRLMSAEEMGELVSTTDLAKWREATVNDTNIKALPMLYVSHIPNITDITSDRDLRGRVMTVLDNCKGLTLF
eukprot:gene18492-24990_t